MRIWEGACAQCRVCYTGLNSLANVSTARIGDKVYQYLPAMVEYRKEQKKKFETELLRKEAEARKLFGVKQPSDLVKKKEQAEKQKALIIKEQNYKAQMAQYKQNPNKLYSPTFVIAMEAIPVKCIHDGKYLLHLNNIEGKKGFCCLYCNTHYLIARKKAPSPPSKASPKEKSPALKSEKPPVAQKRQLPPEIVFWNKLPKKATKSSDTDTVTVARLESGKYGIRYIGITDQKSEVNMAMGIYWHEHRFAEAVLQAMLHHNPQMEYGELKLRLYEVKRGSMLSVYAEKDDVLSTDPIPLYIYTLKLALAKYDVETVTVPVYFPEVRKHIHLNAYYAKAQNRYYMNAITFNDSVSAYGLPFVRPYTVNNDGSINDLGSKLSMVSELKLYGYNVSAQSNYSDTYRQSLLLKLIHYNLMTKAQIMSHLEFLIHFHQYNIRYSDAVDKWENDLRFIREYNTYGQRSVGGYIMPVRRKNRRW